MGCLYSLIHLEKQCQRESRHESLFSGLSADPLRQHFVHRLTVTHGHQANDVFLPVNGIDDPKAADAIFSQPIEFPLERLK
ncbi:MAG: hypothetical protein A4E19_15410 [Nitrospira sp. SG-bin1]|nr:MAG: hypothetical protein A4E19_15410 [Nitrospira sp. SG-bin1]